MVRRLKRHFARFPTIIQPDAMDCGPSCLAIVARHYGKRASLPLLRDMCFVSRQGASFLELKEAAERIGFETRCVRLNFAYFQEDAQLPCIVHWGGNHFVVVYRITRERVYVSDPALGRASYSHQEFQSRWTAAEDGDGFALLLWPGSRFHLLQEASPARDFKRLLQYVTPHARQLGWLFFGLAAAGAIQFAFPFLTQAIVDKGIGPRDIPFLGLILAGQLMLTLSGTALNFVQRLLVLSVGTRLNMAMVDDFLRKLVRLPISYFDTRLPGGIMQRINDHDRIGEFVTQSFLDATFTVIKVVVFGAVLYSYSPGICAVFFCGSLLYAGWVALFLKRRRIIDYDRFARMSDKQDAVIQLIRGMQEIKLNGCENRKLASWAAIQQKLFDVSRRSLRLGQYQEAGSALINRLLELLIVFMAALAVIEGEFTFGMMLAVQSIVGQLSGPAGQIVHFSHACQDAKIGWERISDVYNRENESKDGGASKPIKRVTDDIVLEGVSFRYGGPAAPWVLHDLCLRIPKNRTTAVVGMSGSGKTTLLKLLLGFYPPTQGRVFVNGLPLDTIDIDGWRGMCGIVMQDGYVFSDTIAGNIALRDDAPDKARLDYACRVARLDEFIASLPLGYGAKVGSDGIGISAGQRQRLLIARAVYKNPEVILFDEATNSLDADNERMIVENLHEFLNGKTSVVVAHRLSTVKNADQIIVLAEGKVSESGTHAELLALRGEYYRLVANQLEC